jgi:hypothetical protein
MIDELFVEPVYDETYEDAMEWIRTVPCNEQGRPQLYLIPRRHPEPQWPRPRRFALLEAHSGLFREFAELDTGDVLATETRIVKFSERFGPLGLKRTEVWRPAEREGEPQETILGEPYFMWLAEITLMRLTVRLFDLVTADDREGLAQELATWPERDRCAILDHHPLSPVLASSDAAMDRRSNSGRARYEALALIQQDVNSHLAPFGNPPVAMQLVWSAGEGRLSLHPIPQTLRGRLWLQCARAVAENHQFRQCTACSSWFRLDPHVARTSRYYCTDACRSRAYRGRQEQARRMHAEGKSIADIARRLESNEATIVGWVRTGRTAPSRRRRSSR